MPWAGTIAPMARDLLIAGGGLGGVAAALACARSGWQAHLFEQARVFSEVGAGIQLGPNTTRILASWGLDTALRRVAAFPRMLRVRSAADGAELACLRLGATFTDRYGAPYATIRRADLQGLLLEAAQAQGVDLRLAARVQGAWQTPQAAGLHIEGESDFQGEALVGADGLWSIVRQQVCADGLPPPTGHVAYRGLATQAELPEALRTTEVTVWLGPHLHVVAYPVRGGEQLNVVGIVEGQGIGPADDWDQEALAVNLQTRLADACTLLRDLVRAMPGWRLWALHDRRPLRSASEMAKGRIALLGDAAHPMRPYLAQGAGMAIEDAETLARSLAGVGGAVDMPAALAAYAQARWQRCSRVQRRSQRNGQIFHAVGAVRWGRDFALRMLGERIVDVPWLYGATGTEIGRTT
jgi:salicylate hydroxylase